MWWPLCYGFLSSQMRGTIPPHITPVSFFVPNFSETFKRLWNSEKMSEIGDGRGRRGGPKSRPKIFFQTSFGDFQNFVPSFFCFLKISYKPFQNHALLCFNYPSNHEFQKKRMVSEIFYLENWVVWIIDWDITEKLFSKRGKCVSRHFKRFSVIFLTTKKGQIIRSTFFLRDIKMKSDHGLVIF